VGVLIPRDEMNELKFRVMLRGKELELWQLRHITEISIDESDTEADMLRLTIVDKDYFFLNNDYLIAKGEKVEAHIGYTKHCIKKFSGTIAIAEAVFDASGQPVLTLSAIDSSKAFTGTTKTRKFLKNTIANIVTTIAKEYQFKVVTTPDSTVVDEVTQDNETDAQFINRLAENEGYVWYLVDSTLYFGKRLRDDMKVSDVLTYRQGNNAIMSFQPMRIEKNKDVTSSGAKVDDNASESTTTDKADPNKVTFQPIKTGRAIVVDGATGRIQITTKPFNTKMQSSGNLSNM
jgi:phage protein D